jgi:predicted nucleotidyltransferase component of viral defense system
MKLHEDKTLFREAIEAAAQHLKLRPVFIEKDYWVTYVLRNLGLSKFANNVIFKGGTSLSKAYHCIDRFSEDIDLAILSPGDYTGNQLKNLLKEITETISKGLHIIEGHGAEKKMGRMRTTACAYEKAIDNVDIGVVKDYILIEINCFADPIPYSALPISSYITQFFAQTGNEPLIQQYEMEPTTINVLSLERTFFEKVLSLNRLSYEGKTALQEKIRHFYDLHQLFYFPSLAGRLLNRVHFPILLNILKNDWDNKAMHGSWQGQRLQDSPLFKNLEAQWKELSLTYQSELADLIWTGALPSPSSIETVLRAIRTFIIAFDEQHPPPYTHSLGALPNFFLKECEK